MSGETWEKKTCITHYQKCQDCILPWKRSFLYFSFSLLQSFSSRKTFSLTLYLCSQFIYHNLIRHGPKALDLDVKFITSPFMMGIVFEYIFGKIYKRYNREFPGFPVLRTLHFHCRVPGWGQTNK